MSAELTRGEAGPETPATSTTHIQDNSVMSNNINILNRVNHLGNDPREAEDFLLISAVATSQSLATAPQSVVSQARSEADRDPLDGAGAASGTLYASVITSSYSGPQPSEVVDACARTAFSGKLGHKNAISDECSSNGGRGEEDGGVLPPVSLQSDGAVVPGLKMGSPLPSTQGDSGPTRVVCETKTVNQHYDIPTPDVTQDHDTFAPPSAQTVTPSFNKEGDSSSSLALATYPAVACDSNSAAKRSLSSSAVPTSRRGGWTRPPGGGLRGGAPLPGETSAISNGTSGWGPPPSNSAGGGGTGGWGTATPATPSTAWGSSQPNNGDTDTANNSKMLNTIPPSSQSSQQASQAPAPAPAPGTQGSTSWAAAAGKGLPPSEGSSQQNSNGGTNKQLEQLNSVREALFSQDGWGCQHVKQDTSWDMGMGGSGPANPPAAAAAAAGPTQQSEQVPAPPAGAAPKPDNMQWTPPGSSGRNDGTDLWRTTLSGVPQPSKPATATPWGNHTPAHPADYKTWGEPDQELSGEGHGAPSQPDNSLWNPAGGASALAEPGAGGRGGHGGGWEQERLSGPAADRAAPGGQFDDRDRPSWGGAPKPKEEPMGWRESSNQWGPGGGGAGNNGSGWGGPPAKTSQAGGWGNAPGGQQAQARAPQWENESPPMGRRFDDGGTSLWGAKPQPGMPGPPGGWKDMPVPNTIRGPPGSTSRLPPGGPGVKPAENSPWGGAHPGRGWEEGGLAGSAGSWGPMEEKQPRAGSGGDMWSDNKSNWSNGNRLQTIPGMRSSPSWDESPVMADRNWGGPSGARPGAVTKDFIWNSKQFRILCEMGYVNEDVETALRKTNMQLDDALEMLNALNRGGMPGGRVGGGGGGGGLPPNDVFPPRRDEYNMRFPGPMPYPPGSGDLPGSLNRPGSINPSMSGQIPNGGGPNLAGGPPRPQPGPPSTSQLRVLVQQIQMAVQAGHLNPQILNQPLAPQTLYLLNQLLHRIKELQSCQQQHAMAQAQAGQRPGTTQQKALLGMTVQITQHKQQITNLQNQITAQQAQYLKNQQPQPNPGQNPDELAMGLSGMNMAENGSTPSSGGSKLLQMINKDNDNFARAPGSAKTSTSSPNLLLDNGPWSNGQGNSGWPDSSGDKPANTSNSTDDDNFGIPEFVPGKAWKGAAQMKDPTEDPTMTPGSVASSAIIAPLTSTEKTTSSAADTNHSLSSSTWSLSTPTTKEVSGGSKDSWGLPTSSSSNTLTEMGQNLWGQSRSQSSKQQTPTTSITGWPTSNGLTSSGGWSNGSTTTTSSSYLGSVGSSGSGSAWLLLKNLTAQIDGSTLRTLCMQHGPLHNFHLYLTHGIALVKYSNGQEAKKAQNALNNCVLGNTTILAATAEEQEVESIIRTLSQHSAGAPGGYNSTISKSTSSGERDTWSSMGSSVSLGWPASSLGGSVWGAPDSDQHNRTTPLNSFLPPDLLGEGM